MTTASLKSEEEASFFAEDRDQPVPPPNVVAYNELRSCADLFRMHANGKLEIQPDFQREVVWKHEEQSRFIDSLVKQLPIPSMCFSLDYKSQHWKVIDGLQRMHTITSFLGSADWMIGNVDDIDPQLRGRKNNELRSGTPEQRAIYSSVEDLTIPITVIRCSYAEPSHLRYLFMIFNRLNSGGVRLNNQEIRNCIYSGPFNDLLKGFDKEDRNWRAVSKRVWGKMDRFRSVELLLRALAFAESRDKYEGNLAGFLNDYMHAKSKLAEGELKSVKSELTTMARAANLVLGELGGGKRSLTIVESVLVGLLANRSRLAGFDTTRDQKLIFLARGFSQRPSYSSGARYALASVVFDS